MKKILSGCLSCLIISLLSAQSPLGLDALILSPSLEESVEMTNCAVLNSEYLDYSPIILTQGLVFTSNRPMKKSWLKRLFSRDYSSLFYAERHSDGMLGTPYKLPGDVNGQFNEGAATISPDGQTMIFTRNNDRKNKDGSYDLSLHSAQLVDNQWVNVRLMELSLEGYTDCHPSLSADGRILYFSSNRLGGFGGMDLYQSTWQDGQWQTAENLGAAVNTYENELFPQITTSGSLYFSAESTTGLGGLDIYQSSVGETGQRQARQILGAPFNSKADDFGLVIATDGQSGYFTSGRDGGAGKDDIYSWQFKTPVETELPQVLTRIDIQDYFNKESLNDASLTMIELSVALQNAESLDQDYFITNQLEESLIDILGVKLHPATNSIDGYLYEIKSDKNYLLIASNDKYMTAQRMVSGEMMLRENGFVMELKTNDLDYLGLIEQTDRIASQEPVVMRAPGYQMPSATATENFKEPVVLLAAVPPATDEEFTAKGGIVLSTDRASIPKTNYSSILTSINHNFNEYLLNADLQAELKNIIGILITELTSSIIIESHTDNQGSKAYNQRLSNQRAIEVKNFLIQKGIAASRITAIGYGAERPLIECGNGGDCHEEQHRRNRRTEFILNRP